MFKSIFLSLLLGSFVLNAEDLSKISYHASEVPMDGLYYYVDLDQDGTYDYFFQGYTVTSTYSDGPATQIPQLAAYGLNGNSYLMDTNGNILQVEPGQSLGPDTRPGEIWGQAGDRLALLSSGSGDDWSGFTGKPPEYYIGVRFSSGGKQHYGWIRLIIPTRQPPQGGTGTIFPVVVDWAYATRAGESIRAGDAGSDDEPNLFTIDFENPDGTLQGSDARRSAGSLLLEGDTVYYEMVLDGAHTNLDIYAVNQSRPLFSVEQAPPTLPGFPTYFMGTFKLSCSQIEALQRGLCFASVDQDSILGLVEPADQKKHSDKHPENDRNCRNGFDSFQRGH